MKVLRSFLKCALLSALVIACGEDAGNASDEDATSAAGVSAAGMSAAGASAAGMGAAGQAGTSAGTSTGASGTRAGESGSAGVQSGAGSAGMQDGPAGDGGDGGGAGSGGGEDASTPDAGSGGGDSERPGWTLMWSDEFDGPEGSSVDAESWNLVDKGDGFGNNELQHYTPRPENVQLDGDGFLVITAREESHGGRQYTSARLESNGKIEVTYGRIEARIHIPRGQGIWPAFWMLGVDIGSVGWPTCGEIDILENIGREPTTVHGTLHGPGYSGGNPVGAPYQLPDRAPFADDFHVYSVEWEENVVRFYVDDVLYQTRTPDDVPGDWVYDHAFYLLLNVAVGGQWPGPPDETTVFPQTMRVDYVRVYTRE
jgi:beta-glucanase (GH16 family)